MNYICNEIANVKIYLFSHIREETLEKEFQEKLLEWMQMAEITKQEQDEAKCRVEEIIRKEKVVFFF